MENLADDPSFIDAIVHEVKSQGLFDQFRKECLADVDTKPAYQNLRQRVESSVSKFLSQQKWIDNIRHKNQLREKLRRNIIESGFLETGVERIVDQVVNPKISTVFHPKVEEIVYNYLGIEKPKLTVNGGVELDVQTDFLPEDLEAVSPDSDKKSTTTSSDLQPMTEQSTQEELNDSKEHIDDFESPAFEPLEPRPPSQTKHDSNDSSASAISGLTSQESVENESNDRSFNTGGSLNEKNPDAGSNGFDEQPNNAKHALYSPLKGSPEIAQNDSQLSQVSSNSRLSIITNSESIVQHHQPNHQTQKQSIVRDSRLDITEEAQMPNFHENSNEEEGELTNSDGADDAKADVQLEPQKSNFDLRQEVYDFKCTEHKRYDAVEMERFDKEKSTDRQDSVVEDGLTKTPTFDTLNKGTQKNTSPIVPAKYDENSSHSERSLRICEDSTLETKVLNSSDQMENLDSVKTPLNDEHSTESAPDVDKMDASQVEVISLAAVKHHNSSKDSKKDRHQVRDSQFDRKHFSSNRHRSSSSRDDKKSHSSSKQGSSYRKSDHRDRKHENGNINLNNEGSKKSADKRKDNDDHYVEHEKPMKRRRSTDRDSNDGAENGRAAKSTGDVTVRYTEYGTSSLKNSQHPEKRASGSTSDKLNESLDSNFEGFDEEQLCNDPKKMENISRAIIKSSDKDKPKESYKSYKKIKKYDSKISKEIDRKTVSEMDVFAFSFEKPSKLGKNDEHLHCSEVQDGNKYDESSLNDSIDQEEEEGVIILEPSELAKVIEANEEQTNEDSISDIDNGLKKNSNLNYHQANPDDLVTLATQPVVVDQMLTNGDNMDLELLIGEKHLCGDEMTLNKIQQGLDVAKNKVKKPKIASNFNEARKLMKVRKQMERDEKKKREQALVLAKKLIHENGNENEDDQGIELEFVCDGNRISSAPIISSPMRQKPRLYLEDEPELLYFKEEDEIFTTNIKLIEYLKMKTENISVPDEFIRSNNRLYSLYNGISRVEEVCARNILSELENTNSVMETTKSILNDPDSTINKASYKSAQVCSDYHNMESSGDTILTSKTNFVGCMSSKSITSVSCAEDVYSTNQSISDSIGKTKESASNSVRTSKIKRLGLSKPKRSVLSRNSTAILTVDISDVKPIEEEKGTPGNNNNDIIRAKRYSSDDLYKPRSLTSRTRTRANEQVGM